MYDILVKNGRIFDGTGSAPYAADVAIVKGDIVALGRLEGEAAHTIYAAGLAVAPGFIDIHTHSDFASLLDPTAQSKVRQGVTLEVAGNCGYSFCAPLEGSAEEMLRTRAAQYTDSLDVTWEDFGGYLDAIQSGGTTLNLAVQVGHATVRACVLGLEDRSPDIEEMDRMKSLVAECLDAGAIGLSSGTFYSPGSYARPEEVFELATVAADREKLYSTHIRDEGSQGVGLFVALAEAVETGLRTGVRVEVSHVKCAGSSVWGQAGDLLDVFERATMDGVDIAGDQYPYTAASGAITGVLFPRWSLEGGRDATLRRMANPRLRSRLAADIDVMYSKTGNVDDVTVARFAPEPRYEGMKIARIAQELECGPAEAALRLYERGDGQLVLYPMQETDVEEIASHPLISVGSDGSSLSAQGVLSVGKPHPRSYGTNPRFLARFVRERRLVPLEEAVRKMTLLPASRLGLTRRGRIAPGHVADLVVFDPDTIVDTATFDSPHSYPEGIPHVVVNGVMAVENGQSTGSTPGRVIRNFGD